MIVMMESHLNAMQALRSVSTYADVFSPSVKGIDRFQISPMTESEGSNSVSFIPKFNGGAFFDLRLISSSKIYGRNKFQLTHNFHTDRLTVQYDVSKNSSK